MKRILILLIGISFGVTSFAQKKHTVSGRIADEKGEALIGANVIVTDLNIGTVTNKQGEFKLTLREGNYKLKITYVGFDKQTEKISLTKDIRLDFNMVESTQQIEEVQVSAEAPDKNVTKIEMSVNKLEMKQIQKLPVVFGEGDVIKTLQLLPGVISAGEASGGFHVRGGNVDQNLILLDNAQVYNASHAVGFFSVFNSNVIDDVKLHKGGIAPEYGGRLSSVLDINTIDPSKQNWGGEASVGIISSKALIEGPIVKDKVSLFVAGRRTYADLFLPFSKDSLARESKLGFYDLNAKLTAVLSKKDRLYISAYYGRDIVELGDLIKQNYGNEAYTARWNHFFDNRLFMNTFITVSKYQYDMKFTQDENWGGIKTEIFDINLKSIFNYKLNPTNTLRFGGEATRHDFSPGHLTGKQAGAEFDYKLTNRYSWEYGLFIQNEQVLSPRLSASYGLRYSLFHNIGEGVSYGFDKSDKNDYIPNDTSFYGNGEVYNLLPNGIEPRIALRYLLNSKSSLKASYNRMYQYIQLASNSTSSLPLEYWFPTSPNIKPQIVDQVAAGYFRNFADNLIEVSVEGFYKDIKNSIDFKDHANLILNEFYEGQLRSGKAWAYGGELLIRKNKGKLTGWISYTYSRSFKKIPEINNGKAYAASFDKPHDIAVVLSYDISKRVNLAGTWVYTSAPPRTMPQQRWSYDGMIAPAYGERNSVRIFPYHRMDLAATFRLNKQEKNWEHFINVSIYNAYARHNYIMIRFEEDPEIQYQTNAIGTYLYSFVPSVNYTIKF